MKKALLRLTLCLSLTTPLFAQVDPYQEFVRIYGHRVSNALEATAHMVPTPEGGFVMVGTWQDSAFAMKLTPCGEEIWNRKFKVGTSTALEAVCGLPGGGWMATGNCTDCAPGDTARKAWVVRLDPAGNMVADTMLGMLNRDAWGKDLVLTPTGKVAVTGTMVVGGLGITNAYLATFHPALNLLGFTQLNRYAYDSGDAITITADSGVAIAGRSSAFLFDPWQAQLYRLDKNDDTLWTMRNGLPGSWFNDIAADAQGRLVAVGTHQVDTLVKYDAHLMVVNAQTGTLIAQRDYGSPEDDEALEVHPTAAGVLIAGEYGLPSDTGFAQRDWVFRTDNGYNPIDNVFYDGWLVIHGGATIVPLSPDGTDFACASTITSFSHRDIYFVKRRQNGHRIAFEEVASHYQLLTRDPANEGHGAITGTAFAGPGQYSQVHLAVVRNDTILNLTVQALGYVGGQAPFSVDYDIPAGLQNYHLTLTGISGPTQTIEMEACDVVAGDAFIIQGQSNAEAGLPWDPMDTVDHAYRHHRNPFVRNFGLRRPADSLYTWHREADDDTPYADKRSGQWGLVLADSIVRNHGVPVAIMNGGIGGILIQDMFPNPNDHLDTATTYGRFLRRVQRSGLDGSIRAIMFFQGESNAAGWFADNVAGYKAKFATLYNAWATDFPGRERDFLFQIRPGAYWAGATLLSCLQVEEAHRQLADDYGMMLMSSTGMNHDSTHYYYQNGYQRAGRDLYRLVDAALYGAALPANSTPPNVDSAWFSNPARTELTLRMRVATDALTWTPGWEGDFRIEGDTAVDILSGAVAGDKVILQLTAAPAPTFTGISFTSHPGGSACAVKNARGIGMLCFYNVGVDPFVGIAEAIGISGLSIAIFPNPTSESTTQIQVTADRPERLTITLYTLDGRPVTTGQWEVFPGTHRHPLPLPVAQGLYNLTIRTETGEHTTLRLVRQ